MRKMKSAFILITILLCFITSAASGDLPAVTAQFQLTNSTMEEYDPSWAPDDSRLAYTVDGRYGGELWTIDLDGSDRVMYLQSTDWLGQSDWGEKGILYTSQYSFKRDRHYDIWITEGEDVIPRQLSLNKTDQQNPSWNHDNTKILYLGRVNYNHEIWTMEPDTSNITRLTFYQTTVKTPAWSPDSSRIAYSFQGDLWVMNTNGSNNVQLTNDSYEQLDPAWSPCGKWIAYSSDENGDFDIFIIRPDGTDNTTLIREPRDQTQPDWNHDGTKLAYTTYQDLNRDVWVADIYIEPEEATPAPTPLQTRIAIDEKAESHISRLMILGGVIVILVVLVFIWKIVRGMRKK
jgi:TolB protein